MKKKFFVFCGAALLFMACNSDKTAGETTSTDSTDKTTEVKEEAWIPIDSATEMKAWMDYAAVGEAHKAMEASNGTWKGEVTSWMRNGAPPMQSKATMSNRMVFDGRYQISDFKSEFMGMPFNGMAITGYDNYKKKYVSTWIDNMGTGIMKMEGDWDAATKTMHMEGTMINPANGKECKMREVFKTIDDKTQVMEMYGPDSQTGKEYKTMEIKLTKS